MPTSAHREMLQFCRKVPEFALSTAGAMWASLPTTIFFTARSLGIYLLVKAIPGQIICCKA